MQTSEAKNVVRSLESEFQEKIHLFSKSEVFHSGIPEPIAKQLSEMQNRMTGAMSKFEQDCRDIEGLQNVKKYDAMGLAVTRYRLMKNACTTQLEGLQSLVREPQTVTVS